MSSTAGKAKRRVVSIYRSFCSSIEVEYKRKNSTCLAHSVSKKSSLDWQSSWYHNNQIHSYSLGQKCDSK